MSVFDLIILAILAALTLRGIWKGMVSQIVSVASYFVCWIVATRFGGLFAPTIPVESPWNQVLAMGIVFLITLVAIRFVHATLEKLIKDWHLQKLNTLLGGILGFAKGLLLCLIITFFAVMFSETSRAVVFNSMTGFHLVQLITNIGVFVPKDSYEFVHTQLANFQEKVDAADSDQFPEPLKFQSSDTMQQMVAQLKSKEGSTEDRVGSLWSALSQWWSGTKEVLATEADAVILPLQLVQNSTASTASVTTFTPPLPPQLLTPQVNTNLAVAQSAAPKLVAAVEDFFIQRTGSSVPSSPFPQLAALSPSVSPAASEVADPLLALAPLTEILSMLPEESAQLLPTMTIPHHVGSDMLLRNSTLPMQPNVSARVFRP